MSNYIVAEKLGNIFTVSKFTDNDVPDHVATVTLDKRKVTFDYYHPATPKTIDKYIGLVNQFIREGKPGCTIYFYGEYNKISSHCYSFCSQILPVQLF